MTRSNPTGNVHCEHCGRRLSIDDGDAFCDDCWEAIDDALNCLASNLAQAAALCRAFELGGKWTDRAWFGKYDGWKPGCGRSAP